MPKPRRVLAYARVSSAEQAIGSSLRDQQESMRRHAESLGLTIAKSFVEAESSLREKFETRKQMQALMREIREGDLVLCAKLDRWSRDPEFSYASIRQIRERKAAFYAVDDKCDPSTNEGDTMLNFRILFAREEHKRIKERMVGTRKLLKAQGLFSEGAVPFGYRRSLPKGVEGPTKNVLVIEPREAEIVRRIFKMCAGGVPFLKIAKALADDGVSYEIVTRALSNRIYLGEMKGVDGLWIKAQHPPIVEADLWARAEASKAARRIGGARPRDVPSQTSTWILRDVANCAKCGRKLASSYAGLKSRWPRFYYRCVYTENCTRAFANVRKVEALAEPLIVERLKELREELAREPDAPRATAVDHTEKKEKVARRRGKYLEAFADDLLTKDELKVQLAKLDAELLRLEGAELASKKMTPLEDAKVRREALKQVKALAHAWKRAEPTEQRQIVNHLVVKARLDGNAPPRMEWRSAEELAEDDGNPMRL